MVFTLQATDFFLWGLLNNTVFVSPSYSGSVTTGQHCSYGRQHVNWGIRTIF